MGFARFMATGLGRLLRMVVGLALVLYGVFGAHGALEYVLSLVGVVAFAAGLFNFCTIAPLIGAPFRGEDAK
jgi:hypothetical protein